MAAVNSTMLLLGTPAPSFNLSEPATKKFINLDDFTDHPAYLIMFICNHCPYVKHLLPKLTEICKQYKAKGVAIFAISSNDTNRYPEDNTIMMIKEAKDRGFSFPYLFDENQSIAKAYRAACTPEFYLFDSQKKLVYRGQFDDSRPGNGISPTGSSLTEALDSLLSGKRPNPENQKPSIGCNIKWKPGNEPDYFQ
jgi:thiol-disulfide isomerase/thioredoxin